MADDLSCQLGTGGQPGEIVPGYDLTRRRFLGYLTGGLVAAVAALLGIPLSAYVLSPVLEQEGRRWIEAVKLKDLAVGKMNTVRYEFQKKDGWRNIVQTRLAYVMAADGTNFTAFSSSCTHLGCTVRWDDQSQEFRCPCHVGVFDSRGRVVSGPPPAPLVQLNTKVEKGILFVEEV